MIVSVSKRAVLAVGVALAVLALIGLYQGFNSTSEEGDVTASGEGLLPTANAVSARNAAALTEPAGPVLTEAQIRSIARQEAQAVVSGPSEPASSGGEQRSTSGPATSSPAPERPSPPSPAPGPQPAPAQAPPAAEPPPLF